MKLGLDWDDTVTSFPEGFKKLAELSDEVYIITINDSITVKTAKELLGPKVIEVFICPSLRAFSGESHIWKAEVCEKLKVDIMFDDDPEVIEECSNKGIPSIRIGE